MGFDARWRRESVSSFDMEQDLVVGEALEGEASKGYDFKQNNSIAPDIRHRGEKPFGKTFRRHPSHWQHSCQFIEVVNILHFGIVQSAYLSC